MKTMITQEDRGRLIEGAVDRHLAGGGKLRRFRNGIESVGGTWKVAEGGCCALSCLLIGREAKFAVPSRDLERLYGLEENWSVHFMKGFDGSDMDGHESVYRMGEAIRLKYMGSEV